MLFNLQRVALCKVGAVPLNWLRGTGARGFPNRAQMSARRSVHARTCYIQCWVAATARLSTSGLSLLLERQPPKHGDDQYVPEDLPGSRLWAVSVGRPLPSERHGLPLTSLAPPFCLCRVYPLHGLCLELQKRGILAGQH